MTFYTPLPKPHNLFKLLADSLDNAEVDAQVALSMSYDPSFVQFDAFFESIDDTELEYNITNNTFCINISTLITMGMQAPADMFIDKTHYYLPVGVPMVYPRQVM